MAASGKWQKTGAGESPRFLFDHQFIKGLRTVNENSKICSVSRAGEAEDFHKKAVENIRAAVENPVKNAKAHGEKPV